MQDMLIFLGRFHVLVLHLPIGITSALVLLEIGAFLKKSRAYESSCIVLLVAATVSAAVAAALGWMLSNQGGYDETLLFWHKWLGTAVALALALALLLRLQAHWLGMPGASCKYYATLAGAVILLMLAGHDGGSLTHGSTYLTEHMPKHLARSMGQGESHAGAVMEAQVFSIFRKKCMSCHGEQKQKGDYRLDKRDIALRGGESEEEAIVPGKPMRSHLVELILLAESDEDVMPPKGKPRLTQAEVLTIVQWIREGAKWEDPVASAPSGRAVP